MQVSERAHATRVLGEDLGLLHAEVAFAHADGLHVLALHRLQDEARRRLIDAVQADIDRRQREWFGR